MFARKPLSGMIVAALTLSACTGKFGRDRGNFTKITVNSSEILNDSSLSPKDKAENLALAAEQLVTGQSFMYADEVASAALSVDSGNKRAQLIKALVAPSMTLKGVLERVKPIAYRNERSRQEYDKTLAGLSKMPNSALKSFLFTGQPDIKNEKDAQKFIGQIQGAFEGLRQWFKDNKNVEMTLHLPAEFTEQAVRDQGQKCAAEQVSKGVFEVECDFSRALEVNINQADIEVAQQIMAGYVIYLSLYNSYDLSGVIATSDKFSSQPDVKGKIVFEELLKNKDYGVVRDEAALKNILSMGIDAIAGLRWAQKLQKQLCPSGQGVDSNRPGFLVASGICVDQDSKPLEDSTDPQYRTFGDVMKAVELVLRGGVISATFNGALGSITTDIKPSAIFANPIKDVRNLMPLTYDKCENVVGTADNTLGGIFVRGNANSVLQLDRCR